MRFRFARFVKVGVFVFDPELGRREGAVVDAPMWANLIAGLAFLVSVVAAVFSWRSAAQAKRANNLAVHQYQRELHQAFYEVRNLFVTHHWSTQQIELIPFEFSFQNSHLYVSAALSKKLLSFYDECFQVEDLHHRLDMQRDYSRMCVNDPVPLDADVLGDFHAVAKRSEAKAREDLTECVERALNLAEEVETLFKIELKLK